MQCTVIGVCQNGQQVVLGTDLQEHRVQVVVQNAVSASRRFEHAESRYRSFFMLGTTDKGTSVARMDSTGYVLSTQVGFV